MEAERKEEDDREGKEEKCKSESELTAKLYFSMAKHS